MNDDIPPFCHLGRFERIINARVRIYEVTKVYVQIFCYFEALQKFSVFQVSIRKSTKSQCFGVSIDLRKKILDLVLNPVLARFVLAGPEFNYTQKISEWLAPASWTSWCYCVHLI